MANMDLFTFRSEALAIMRISLPMIFVSILQMIIFATSAPFCGHLSKELMDAVSLANMFINMFALAPIFGMTSACYTIFAQVYGSQSKASMGVHLQTGLLVLLLACVPPTALFLNVEYLMVLAGQNEYISRKAGQYILFATAGIPAFAVSSVLRSYTYSQGIIHVHYLILMLSNLVNVGMHILFLYVFQIGISGAGLAFCLTNWLTVSLYLVYIFIMKSYEGLWSGWTIDCVDNLCEFLGLAIPGLLMNLFEWGVYDIFMFIAGFLGEVELAAYGITYYLTFLATMTPIGLQYGAGVRVGHLLGANKPELARFSCRVTLILAPIVGIIFPTVFFSSRHVIPYLFTTNKKVTDLASTCLLWVTPQVFLIASQVPPKGVLRGIGQQACGAVVNFVAFVIIGFPVAISIMFETNLGVIGTYIAMIMSHFIQLVLYILRLLKVDWHHEANLAQERSKIKIPEDYIAFKDTGADYTRDGVNMKSPKVNCVTTSKGYGTVMNTFSETKHQKTPTGIIDLSEKDEFPAEIYDKVLTTVGHVAEDNVKRRKRCLQYKLATILSACLTFLGAAICLRHYLKELHGL